MGQKQYHRNLGKFGRLKRKRPQRQPSFGPIILIAYKYDCNRQKDCRKVSQHSHMPPPVIVHIGYHKHPGNTQKHGKSLLL